MSLDQCTQNLEKIYDYIILCLYLLRWVKIDADINKTNFPYIFKISGQTYHAIGSLLPLEGEKLKFA